MIGAAKATVRCRLCQRLICRVFRAETPSLKLFGGRSEWNAQNSPRRARLGGRSATALVDQAFPVSQSCLHLSRPPPSFPSARRVRGIHRSGRVFHLGSLTTLGKSRQKKNAEMPHLTSPECALSFPLTSNSRPGLSFRLQSGTRTAAWVSVGFIGYFVVLAVDSASLIVLRDLLVNGEVKETMETFGLGIGNRDICESERHLGQSDDGFVVSGQSDRPRPTLELEAFPLPGQSPPNPLSHPMVVPSLTRNNTAVRMLTRILTFVVLSMIFSYRRTHPRLLPRCELPPFATMSPCCSFPNNDATVYFPGLVKNFGRARSHYYMFADGDFETKDPIQNPIGVFQTLWARAARIWTNDSIFGVLAGQSVSLYIARMDISWMGYISCPDLPVSAMPYPLTLSYCLCFGYLIRMLYYRSQI